MKIKILLMAVVLAGLLFSLSASATTITPDCGTVPIQKTTWVKNTQIDKFDQTLGTLQEVRLSFEPCGFLDYQLESTDASTIDYTIDLAGEVIATLPVVGDKLFQITTSESFVAVPDGNSNDNTGTDYIKIVFGSESAPECDVPTEITFTGADMASFIGNAGDKIVIPATGTSATSVDGSANYHSSVNCSMGVTICVEYDFLPPLCINGTKINECTGAGIPGWEICLTDSDGQKFCTTTDANGDYSFCGLLPGDYQVSETLQAGWTPLDQTSRDVTLDEESAEGVDFTNVPLVCISGHKFNDLTNAGLSGWTINLEDASGTVIKTATTGTDGSYEFCDLAPGSYTVCEVMKSGWKAVGPTCIPVELVACENSEDNDFSNVPVTQVCVCPFFIKNELYTVSCHGVTEIDASKGILANDPAGSIVLNPETITIDPKYGTISVEEDGSFVYDPTGATALRNGVYVMFNYAANNGQCDSKYLGIAKMQIMCK